MLLIELCAEREGFEPPVPLSTPVFKTGAFDHSAISPWSKSECKGTGNFLIMQIFQELFCKIGQKLVILLHYLPE